MITKIATIIKEAWTYNGYNKNKGKYATRVHQELKDLGADYTHPEIKALSKNLSEFSRGTSKVGDSELMDVMRMEKPYWQSLDKAYEKKHGKPYTW